MPRMGGRPARGVRRGAELADSSGPHARLPSHSTVGARPGHPRETKWVPIPLLVPIRSVQARMPGWRRGPSLGASRYRRERDPESAPCDPWHDCNPEATAGPPDSPRTRFGAGS